MKKIFYFCLGLALILMPSITLAQTHDILVDEINRTNSQSCSSIRDFSQLVTCAIQVVVRPLVALVIGLAVLYFLWGILTYIQNANNEDKRSEGRKMMIWGIIALFVMVSVWGLVNVLISTFGLDNSTVPAIPTFPRS